MRSSENPVLRSHATVGFDSVHSSGAQARLLLASRLRRRRCTIIIIIIIIVQWHSLILATAAATCTVP